MLGEFRTKRQESLLVEAISALRHADSKDLGQTPDHSSDADHREAATRIGRFTLTDLALATLTVYQTTEIRNLLDELAASTAPLPGWDEPPELDLQCVHESLEANRQTHESLQDENDLLLLQLHQVQEELERSYLRNLDMEKRTKDQQLKNEPQRHQLRNLDLRREPDPQPQKVNPCIKSLARRVQLIENSTSWRLTTPLRLLSQTLSRKNNPHRAPDASAPDEKRIRYLQRRIEQLETSTSWRVTAPLRAIGRILKGQSGIFRRSPAKLISEEAHRTITTLKSELAEESNRRCHAERLADERSHRLIQESESCRKAEQIAEELNRQLIQESDNRRKAEQLAEERARLLTRLSTQQSESEIFDRKLTKLQAALAKQLREQSANTVQQIEAFQRLHVYLGDKSVMPNMHGWPISADLGVLLIRLIEAEPYDAVVELGSGVSTAIIATALQKAAVRRGTSVAPMVSFEHLQEYFLQTAGTLDHAQLREQVTLVSAPLVDYLGPDGNTYRYYECRGALGQLREQLGTSILRIFIFVDGPPAATGPRARYPALPLILEAFPETARLDFLMDDYIREDENVIVAEWESYLTTRGRSFRRQIYPTLEKQACLLTVNARLSPIPTSSSLDVLQTDLANQSIP
jgi:hypothetical protein